MKVYCNGFNLYKKFKTSEHVIKGFTDILYEDLTDLEVSLSFAVFRAGNQFYLSGGNFTETKKLHFDDIGTVICLSCTNDNIFVLNMNGALFKIDICDLSVIEELRTAERLGYNEKFVHFVCGDKIHVASTDQGHLYDLPNRLEFENNYIIDIKVGAVHCLILDSRGNIYTFGSGSRGQLGTGTLEDEEEPVLVDALAGIFIVAIACGTWHCVVVSKEGDVYTWGWNGNGQLGLPMSSSESGEGVSLMATPHVVDFDDSGAHAVKVACGKRHTIVLLDNGKLYGCGFNKYKQLLDVDGDSIEKMTHLHDFSDEKVTCIKCGPWNSIVCCQ